MVQSSLKVATNRSAYLSQSEINTNFLDRISKLIFTSFSINLELQVKGTCFCIQS